MHTFILTSKVEAHPRKCELVAPGDRYIQTLQPRWVPIHDNLKEILNPYVRTEGPVTPRSYQRLRKLREKAEKAAGLWPWPQNALRHSYISYRLALIEDVAKVALEAGHDPKTLAAWYRRPIRKEVAEKFWSILP